MGFRCSQSRRTRALVWTAEPWEPALQRQQRPHSYSWREIYRVSMQLIFYSTKKQCKKIVRVLVCVFLHVTSRVERDRGIIYILTMRWSAISMGAISDAQQTTTKLVHTSESPMYTTTPSATPPPPKKNSHQLILQRQRSCLLPEFPRQYPQRDESTRY